MSAAIVRRSARSGIVAGSTLALIGLLFYANYIDNTVLSNSDDELARQLNPEEQVTNDFHGEPECHPHGGVPINHDADTTFVEYHDEKHGNYKQLFDTHRMPKIVKIESSFYFRTLHPQAITGKSWPALSRAWNDTFVVVDDEEFPEGVVWGSIEAANDAAAMWSVPPSFDKGSDESIDSSTDATSSDDATDVRILPPGDYATYSGWLVGNFGHYLHDHVSKIAWLKDQVPINTKFILPYLPIHEEIMKVVDDDFVEKRVIWVNYDETVHVPENGSLTVMVPHKNTLFGAYPQTGSVFTEHFRQWLENAHWKKSHRKKSKRKSKKSKKVIFYSRAGGTSRRLIDPQQQEEILAMIRSKMLQYGRKEDDLVIYSGKDGDGNSLSIEDQFDLFSSADTAIGPHGSGLANVIWMDPRCNAGIKVLEFASSSRTHNIQTGSFWGYWMLYGSLPWIDYHYMYYMKDSESNAMHLDLVVFEQTLDDLWGTGSVSK